MDGRTEDTQPDAPAVPGRSDATSILRSSTPPSQRHVTPQIQPEEAEAQAPVENSNTNLDEPNTADKSLMNLLKECIPVDSTSIWRAVVNSWPKYATVRLKSDDPDVSTPIDVWERVDHSKSADHLVLVIEGIDDEWCAGRRAARHGYAVQDAEGNVIGEVTSGAPSPTLGYPIAMARIDRAFAAEGTEVQVDLRGRGESFSVVPLPFYKRER